MWYHVSYRYLGITLQRLAFVLVGRGGEEGEGGRGATGTRKALTMQNKMTLQTLAGERPFRMSFTEPPLMCSTAASIDDRKNLGKSQVKVHLHSQDACFILEKEHTANKQNSTVKTVIKDSVLYYY